jgi:hypothetical protein
MSIKFVAAALAGLLVAGTAFAAAPVSATLQTPLAAKSRVVAGGAVWTCEGSSCVAPSAIERTVSVSACRELTKVVGAVSAFGNGAKMLDADSLARCNVGARAR